MASKKVNGITIAINADTSGVTSNLKELTDQSVSLSKQLKSVEALLDMDPGNTELIAQKQELLAKAAETSASKLEALRAAQEDVKAAVASGSIGTDEYIAFQRELITTEKRLNDLQSQSDDTGEEMEELAEGTDEAGDEMRETADESDRLGDKLKNGLAAGAKAAAAAVAAAGAATAKLVTEVISQTGELEQNIGGAESVFADNAEKMMKAGEEAYKNLGLTQSEYLATANKMGALLQGSGFSAEKSAEITQEAMQRAADMASVMGIELSAAMESVAGAAKGNFTMMDNLGVSINDTTLKAYAAEKGLGEMATTQDKVNVAMQLFLDKTKQYKGNFAKEATKTISGSFGLLKASWDSMIAGLGNSEADISNLADNVIESLMSVVDNVEPVIDQIVESLPNIVDSLISAADKLIPRILPSVLSIFNKLLDALIKAIPTLIPVVKSVLQTVVETLIANAPTLIKAALELIVELGKGIAESLPVLVPQIIGIVKEIAKILADKDTLNNLLDAAISIITELATLLIDNIPLLWDASKDIIKRIAEYLTDTENLKKIVNAAGEILTKLGKALVDLSSKLGPFLLDLGKAWAEMFIGDIDYDATASDVLSRLGKAFVHNFFHSPEKLGEWVYDLFNSGETAASDNASGHWAVGGIFTSPTRAIIGENGAEAVLPLENNTGWMDMLAAKIAERGGDGGLTVGSITVNVQGGDNVGYDAVQKVDEALREYQIMMRRGTGGVSW